MRILDLADVELRGGPLVLATDADVDALERDLGSTLPVGYREYVTRLGEGTLNAFVRVLPPWAIRSQLDQHRGMMAGYWFWDGAADGIDQAWGMESIPIADTLDGDALAVHPAHPGRIVILPRNLERAYVRDGLLEAIEWVCSGRVLRSFGTKRYFQPFSAEDGDRGHADASESTTAPKPDGKARSGAAVATSAREHLLAYFEELREVEEWLAQQASGGPSAFSGHRPPDIDQAAFDEGSRKMQTIHARYCTPRLASALGGSVSTSWPPPHDPSKFRIREESTTSKGSAVFLVAEGVEPGLRAQLVEYRLFPDGDGWWIASTRISNSKPPQNRAGHSCREPCDARISVDGMWYRGGTRL